MKKNLVVIMIFGLLLVACGNESIKNDTSDPSIDDPSPQDPIQDPSQQEPSQQEPEQPVVKENCSNGKDDDGNGLIDCNDPACKTQSQCVITLVEDCDNEIDDDQNGLIDCEDPACSTFSKCIPAPPVEICGNGEDDDNDGAIDCEDSDCRLEKACLPPEEIVEICDNGEDDDDNGLIDCLDDACENTKACLPADGSPIELDKEGIWVLPLTYKPYTTLNRALKPTIGNKNYSEEAVWKLISDRTLWVTEVEKYELYGLGAEVVEGEPWIERADLIRGEIPSHSATAKSLAWFWQISDPQLVDEESPCRMEGVTIWPYSVASAYRPQDHLSLHMMDVHIQTGMRISDLSSRPFDFILVTGDIADNAQYNEQRWFQTLIDGGVTDPDSGEDDDPVPGPNNDFADPFYSPGVGNIPWYPAIGNHDLLYMGFSIVTDEIRQACVADHITNTFQYISDALGIFAGHEYREKGWSNGFRDASQPDSPVVTSLKVTTPADPDRRILSKVEALTEFYNAPGMPAGHGLDMDIVKSGWGYYSTYPMPGKPIRLITLDLNSNEFSESNMTREQYKWVETQLKDAKSKKEIVILQSHHDTDHFSGDISQETFVEMVSSYPNVVVHITGHGHENKAHVRKSTSFALNGNGYWEVMLASSIDFPSQTRLFELVWEGGSDLSIYITNVDANAPKGSLVYDAVRLAAARLYFGMNGRGNEIPVKFWEKDKNYRNLVLRVKLPQDVADNLANYTWSDTIESIETLKRFEYDSKD